MTSFQIYLMESSLALAVFYLFYAVLLKKETYYRLNRIYLLVSALFSVVIPFFNFQVPEEKLSGRMSVLLSPVIVNAHTNNHPAQLLSAFEIIYLGVSAVLLALFALKLIQLCLMAGKNSKTLSIKGHRVIVVDKDLSPFSFFNRIYLSRNDVDSPGLEKIIAHEEAHIKNLHSFDISLCELLTALQWINPAAWLLKKEMMAQHEFIADSSAISGDISGYRELLFSYSMIPGGNSVTNNLNSLLKRRLEMIGKKQSSSVRKLKLIVCLPMAAALIMLYGSINSLSARNNYSSADTVVYNYVDQMPEYPGGADALLNFISENVKCPESMKAGNAQVRVMVSFVVDNEGAIVDMEIVKGAGKDYDDAALSCVKKMPKWTPGRQDGKPVAVRVVIPFVFKVQ